MMLQTIVFNEFQENTYLFYDQTGECLVIDPGMNSEIERKEFDDFVKINDLRLKAILNTHCHFDHVLGCNHLKSKYGIPFYIHKQELPVLEKAQLYAEFFGMKINNPPPPDHFIAEGEIFKIGKSEISIYHVPGHSEGSIALYCAAEKILFTGDVLFRGSIGRTDLPGGDYNTLIKSVTKLISLPGNVEVYPGHGSKTTIEIEKNTNPFLV